MTEKSLTQEDRISLRGIVSFVLGLLVILVLTLLAMRVMFDQLLAREVAQDPQPSPLVDPRLPRLPPAPRLQTAPERELRQMRDEEDELLRSYGWVDREAGRVRIPIDRAMDLLAERGLPARNRAAPSEAK
jgi:hypothetical protein